jgi:hypothetical protein
MSKLIAIRRALVAALPDDLKAEVITGPQEPSKTFGGKLGSARMIVRVYVGAPDDPAAQDRLDVLLDPEEDGSISAALFADPNLGDVVKALQIVGVSGWRTWQAKDSPPVLGAELTLEATAC